MEKIIHNQTQLFLDENNILYKYQSAFRKYNSTGTCLSYLNDKEPIGFVQRLDDWNDSDRSSKSF